MIVKGWYRIVCRRGDGRRLGEGLVKQRTGMYLLVTLAVFKSSGLGIPSITPNSRGHWKKLNSGLKVFPSEQIPEARRRLSSCREDVRHC